MSFEKLGLNAPLLKAIDVCGYKTATPIQASAIPVILQGRDLIAAARTGTGKTAAFMLPALHHLSEKSANHRKTRILVLTPTRELAHQITDAARQYGKFIRFSISSIIGGVPYRRQLASLSPAPDIIVATPGRLMDLMDTGKINLSGIEMLILDEADRMLDMGFIDAVKQIIKTTPADRQTLLFSATIDQRISRLARDVLNNPQQLEMPKEQQQKALIEQRIYLAQDPRHKSHLFSELLTSENIYKAIIFSATKHGADRLAKQLCDQGYLASGLHGDLKQNRRNAVLDQLRKDKIQFLVATDVAARGIDIAGITHVFNYDFPKFAEDYVHRIGRTGRAGNTGIAISLALPQEMRHIKQVERYTGQNLTVIRDNTGRVADSGTGRGGRVADSRTGRRERDGDRDGRGRG